jgi:hypothetical protein
MKNNELLTIIEHNLLSRHVDDIEPLFILYLDMKRDFPEITTDQVLDSLVKLVKMGFSECYYTSSTGWEKCDALSSKVLRKSPNYVSENDKFESIYLDDYYFQITSTGKNEEAKPEYNVYYP